MVWGEALTTLRIHSDYAFVVLINLFFSELYPPSVMFWYCVLLGK